MATNEVQIDKESLENEIKVILEKINVVETKNKELKTFLDGTVNEFEGASAKVFLSNNISTIIASQVQCEETMALFQVLLDYCDNLMAADEQLQSDFQGAI